MISVIDLKVTTVGQARPGSAVGWDSVTCRVMQKRRQSVQIMHRSLSAVLFPGYRRRVLGLLLLRPDESLHGREIARRTGLPAGTLTRELKRLAGVGLLTQEKRGNQTLYRANLSSPIFAELAGILRKTSGLADVVAEALALLSDKIDVAFIFGSVARATESAGSDIDLLVIGSVDFGAIVEALYPAQQQLAREINPKVFSLREWKSKVKEKSSFAMDVLAKPKIFLIGDEHELAELAGRKP
jgi:predicted nucleotidyltransferase